MTSKRVRGTSKAALARGAGRARGKARGAPPAFMTPAEYARHRGVSREAVRKALRDGRIRADRRGRIEWSAADLAWTASSEPASPRRVVDRGAAGGPPALEAQASVPRHVAFDPQQISYATARAMREFYQAQLAELELGERSKALLPAEEVRDEQFRAARAARDLLLSIPDRVADVLAPIGDAGEIRRILRCEIEHACQQLAGAPPEASTPAETSA